MRTSTTYQCCRVSLGPWSLNILGTISCPCDIILTHWQPISLKSRLFVSINRFDSKKNLSLAVLAFHSYTQRTVSNPQDFLVLAGGYDARLSDNISVMRNLRRFVSEFILNSWWIYFQACWGPWFIWKSAFLALHRSCSEGASLAQCDLYPLYSWKWAFWNRPTGSDEIQEACDCVSKRRAAGNRDSWCDRFSVHRHARGELENIFLLTWTELCEEFCKCDGNTCSSARIR